MSPLFRDEDIVQEKHVVLEEIRAAYDNPGALASILLDSAVWPNQALGRDIAGTADSVEAATRSMMLDYHAAQYVGRNLVVAVAGDVEHEDVVDQIAALLSDLPDGEPRTMFPHVDNLEGPNITGSRRDLEQLHLAMALKGVGLDDPRREPLRLLNIVLGGSMSSRLFEEVREKRGLAYGIGSSTHTLSDCGVVDIHTGVERARALETTRVIVDELVKIREGVTEDELHDARELAKGRLILGMEDSRAVSNDLAAQELMRGRIETIDSRIDSLDAVTLDEVRTVARDVIVSNKMAVSAVGPSIDEAELAKILDF